MYDIDIHVLDKDGAIRQRLLEIASAMQIPEGALSAIIVASDGDTDYRNCIRQCKGFTGGNTHTEDGAGKTVPFSDGGSISSEVVFAAITLLARSCYSHDAKHFLLYEYVIPHEFGHAIDYFTRSVLQTKPLSRANAPPDELASYYGELLLAEFAACMHAAKMVSKTQFRAMSTSAFEFINEQLQDLPIRRKHLPWFILTQQSQLTGSVLRGAGVGEPVAIRWDGVSDNAIRELEAFIAELRVLAAAYPNWDTPQVKDKLHRRATALGKTL